MGSYELQRTDSICPPPEVQLLEYVKSNNTPKIKSFVNENPQSLNTIIGYPYDKPILYIACHEFANGTKSDTVKTLIDLGANLYYTEDVHNHMEALHFAALGGNPNLLKTIVDNITYGKINSQTSNNNTALNLLVKEGNFNLENYIECIRVLLRADIDVNIPDSKHLTPIFWAAKKNYVEVVEIILRESNQQVDIDSHKLRGKSARDYMLENSINFAFTTPNNNEVENSSNVLFGLLKQNNEDEFVRQDLSSFVTVDDGVQTLLQLATKNGLYRAVDCLLKYGADPNQITQKTPSFPITIAATKGNHKIFKMLLDSKNIVVPPGVLIELLRHSDTESVTEDINFEMCYELLVKNKEQKFNVNDADINKKTALHYAARYGGADKVLDLLRLGASMACKNQYDSLPIEDIDANTLETHLNECMITNVDTNIDKESFTATFNYKTLMPPNPHVKDRKATDQPDVEAACKLIASEVEQLSRETQVISYISKSPELKHLLKHPTITSFLYMKWHRIRWFFYTNLAFYITFCFFLILHILLAYGNHDGNNNNETLTKTLSTLLCITFILLLLREVFQIAVSPKTYFRNLENYIELLIIMLTAYILFKESPSEDARKQVSAFAILISACGMVLLIGQHPKLSTNIVMLRTVSANFFKFLLWYSILIIAFALSFYILLKDNVDDVKTSEDGVKKDDEEINFFTNPGLSLFKTIVMLTGEFDAGSINFDVYPITSHLIFMLFVIMIAIILFNLLNGLAVSDTQMIKSNAELVGHIARIEHIAYIESMLLGHILPASFVSWLQEYFCCLSLNVRRRFAVPGVLIKRVCLFPYFLKDYKLIVYPNQHAKVVFPNDEHENSNSCVRQCTGIYLDKQTAKRIKQLIKERRETLTAERLELHSVSKQNELIKQQQRDIEELKQTLQLILSRIDYMVSHRLS